MKLHTFTKAKGLIPKAKRRGRGNATGTGNYSGRGLKGQKARSGHTMRPSFEGGQTSIVQRLPKARGFKRYFKLVKDYQIINLGRLDLDTRISDTMEISKAVLKELGYIKKIDCLVKILGNGTYAKHLKFTDIDAFSESAKYMMENPGKKVEKLRTKKVVEAKPVEVKKVVEAKKPVEAKEPVVEHKVETPKAMPTKVEKPVKVVEEKVVEVKKPVETPKAVVVKKPAAPIKKVATKPVAKKPEIKKAEVKKPAVKKPVATKPVAKKTAAKPATKPTTAGKPVAKKKGK